MSQKIFLLFAALFITVCYSAQLKKNPKGSIPCRVVDKKTSLPLENILVCINYEEICAKTAADGTCRLNNISPEIYELTAVAEGYDTLIIPNVTVKTGIHPVITINLSKSIPIRNLDKMVIRSRRRARRSIEQTNSVARLDNFELSNTVGTANDINRVLQTMPSVVNFGSDFDNDLYVRGGHSRENLYIVDDIEINNISHFSDVSGSGGAIGYVNAACVDYLDFYVGGMPALAPPRISSIIDMRIRDGSFTHRRYQIDLNMSGLGFITEGPFPGEKTSYLLNVRFNDLHLLEPFLNIGGVPQYGDSHLKLTHLINENHSLSMTGVFGFDILKQTSNSWAFPTNWTEKLFQSGVGVNWHTNKKAFKNNSHGSFSFRNEEYFEEVKNFTGSKLIRENTWDTIYSPPVSIPYKGDTITLGMEKGNYYDRFTKEEMFGTVDNRWHILLKDNFSFYIRDEDQLDIGIRARRSNFNLSERSGRERGWVNTIYSDTSGTELVDSIFGSDTTFLLDSSTISDEIGGYIQYILNSGNFKCVAGVRADYWRLLRDYGISPRIGISYSVPRVGTFSLGGGLYYQDPADLSGYLSDIMVPNPNRNAPRPKLYEIELQRNWQAVFGYERELPSSHHVTFESYYKLYDREYPLVNPDRYEYQDSFWDAYWDNKAWSFPKPTGKKEAYGLELSLKKRKQTGLYYSLAYSLFSVKNRYADKSWYDDKNNLRNTFSGTLGIKFRKFHSLAFRVFAAEGRPYSLANTDSSGILQYDKSLGYYTERLDPLCSMNVRYSFNISRQWGNITGYLEIWNFLNYTPVVERNKGYREYYDSNTNGLIPILGFSVDF